MHRLKLLYADDQIVPFNLSDDEVTKWIESNYPQADWGQSFIKAFDETRETVRRLQNDGYDLTCINSFSKAKKIIRDHTFDIIIVDLGWSGDKSLQKQGSGHKGWELAEAISEIDKRQNRKTPVIMYSIKFLKNPELSRIAAQKSILPVFKSESSGIEGRESLMAAINFIRTQISSLTNKEQLGIKSLSTSHDILTNMMSEALRQYRMWFFATISSASISAFVLVASGMYVLISNDKVSGIYTTISGILVNVFTVLFVRELHKAKEEVNKCREEVRVSLSKLNE
jgi:hypothetical protein